MVWTQYTHNSPEEGPKEIPVVKEFEQPIVGLFKNLDLKKQEIKVKAMAPAWFNLWKGGDFYKGDAIKVVSKEPQSTTFWDKVRDLKQTFIDKFAYYEGKEALNQLERLHEYTVAKSQDQDVSGYGKQMKKLYEKIIAPAFEASKKVGFEDKEVATDKGTTTTKRVFTPLSGYKPLNNSIREIAGVLGTTVTAIKADDKTQKLEQKLQKEMSKVEKFIGSIDPKFEMTKEMKQEFERLLREELPKWEEGSPFSYDHKDLMAFLQALKSAGNDQTTTGIINFLRNENYPQITDLLDNMRDKMRYPDNFKVISLIREVMPMNFKEESELLTFLKDNPQDILAIQIKQLVKGKDDSKVFEDLLTVAKFKQEENPHFLDFFLAFRDLKEIDGLKKENDQLLKENRMKLGSDRRVIDELKEITDSLNNLKNNISRVKNRSNHTIEDNLKEISDVIERQVILRERMQAKIDNPQLLKPIGVMREVFPQLTLEDEDDLLKLLLKNPPDLISMHVKEMSKNLGPIELEALFNVIVDNWNEKDGYSLDLVCRFCQLKKIDLRLAEIKDLLTESQSQLKQGQNQVKEMKKEWDNYVQTTFKDPNDRKVQQKIVDENVEGAYSEHTAPHEKRMEQLQGAVTTLNEIKKKLSRIDPMLGGRALKVVKSDDQDINKAGL